MALRRMTGGRLPRWIAPVAAGLGMLCYGVWLNVTWGGRALAQMPDGLTVVREVESSAWWKPRTLIHPNLSLIAAVDSCGVLRNPAAPDLAMTQLYLFDRHAPAGRAPVLVDCARGLIAKVADGLGFDAAGVPQTERWSPPPHNDRVRAALCGGSAPVTR
jgi:hypothetical protein